MKIEPGRRLHTETLPANKEEKMPVRRERSFGWFLRLLLIVAVALALVGLTRSLSWGQSAPAGRSGQPAAATAEAGNEPSAPNTETPTENKKDSVFSLIFGNQDLFSEHHSSLDYKAVLLTATVRLLLATVLAAILAYRPYRYMRVVQRNPYVAQSQILLAVVACALMMIVADSAARAFGIFAAASLVRFRTNIRDPKEVTVMLIGLSIGLATGVGHLLLASLFTGFVLLLLWVLECYEPAQVFRALELKVRTRDVSGTHEALKEIFEKHHFNAEVRQLDQEDQDDPLGKIVYYMSIPPNISTDRLSDELFAVDAANVDSIEWQQKRSNSYIYR